MRLWAAILKDHKKLASCFCIVTNMKFQGTYPTSQKNYLSRKHKLWLFWQFLYFKHLEGMIMTVVEDY